MTREREFVTGFTDARSFNTVAQGRRLHPVVGEPDSFKLSDLARVRLEDLKIEGDLKSRLFRTSRIVETLGRDEDQQMSAFSYFLLEDGLGQDFIKDFLGVSPERVERLIFSGRSEPEINKIEQKLRYLILKPRFEVMLMRRGKMKNTQIARRLIQQEPLIHDIAGDLIFLNLIEPSNPAAARKAEESRRFLTDVKILHEQGKSRHQMGDILNATPGRITVAINRLIRVGEIFPTPHDVASRHRYRSPNLIMGERLTRLGLGPTQVAEASGISYGSARTLRAKLRKSGEIPQHNKSARRMNFLKYLLDYRVAHGGEKKVSIDKVSRENRELGDRATLLKWYHQFEDKYDLPPIKSGHRVKPR